MSTGRGGFAGSVPLHLKIGYGIGKGADSMASFWFGTLLLIYYNQALGLPGWLAGLAMMIGLSFDGLSDPAVGSFSDGLRSRIGRRHPLILASAIPVGLCFYLLFAPPEGLGHLGLFFWLLGFGVLTRLATTFFNVPHLSLGAELSADYTERTTIVAWRTSFHVLTGALVAVGVWGYFDAHPGPAGLDGQLIAANYRVCAGAVALAMTSVILISGFATLSSVPHLLGRDEPRRAFRIAKVLTDLRLALASRSFRALFSGVFLLSVYIGVQASLGTHLLTFFWHLDELEIRNWQIFAGIGGGLAVLAARPLNGWLDKRNCTLLGVVLFASASTGPVLGDLAGWMPADRAALVWTLYLASAAAALGGVLAVVTGNSMMADVADEHEWVHGVRQEGIYFGSLNFAGKATTALGQLMAGVTVDLVGLDPRSVPAEVPQTVIVNFGLAYSGFIVFMALAGIALAAYDLGRERHDAIKRELIARAGSARVAND